MRILVVDDERVMRLYLSEALGELGHDVVVASNGLEALDRLDGFGPELILTDIRMPKMDGLSLLKHISNMVDPPPVILLTAYSELDSAIQAIQLGASDYLTKPVKLADLAQRVTRLERETELKRQLEHARVERTRAETVRQMVVTLSHDLNNPLFTVISGIAYLADFHPEDQLPPDFDKVIESMQRNTSRMSELLARLQNIEQVVSTEYQPGTLMVDPKASRSSNDSS